MIYPIATIEGVGPQMAERLKAAGVRTTVTLLQKAKDPKGRRALSAASGIDESRLLKFANMADLMRIKGVAEEYAELLEVAGVDTVKELKNRNAANLTKAMTEVNAVRKLVRLTPSEKTVVKWIAQAKSLPPAISY